MKQIIVIAIFLLSSSWGFSASIEVLKQEITMVAKANTNEVQNQKQVRAELDGLITQLTANQPLVTEQDWVQHAPGSWRQIWSDEADNSPQGAPPRNLEKIFQFVSAEGRAVNFGERTLGNGQKVTFALEARGRVQDNTQNTKILKAFSRPQGLISGEFLGLMAQDILSGTLQEFQPVAAQPFPKGPINAESDLTLLFLDEDLKIGTAPNVFSGETELFILERVVSVP